jgi:hypothetical protein
MMASSDNRLMGYLTGMIETMQEIVSKLNKAERRFIPMPDARRQSAILSATSTGDKLQQDVRNWLSPPDPWKNHNLARGSRHGGTGTWWIEGDAYAEWRSPSAGPLLWIHAKRPYFTLYTFFPEINDCHLCSGCRKEHHLVR